MNPEALDRRFRARFWTRVRKAEGNACWIWLGRVDKDGYGKTYRNSHHVRAHRAAFEMECGPLPPGVLVMHTCDNPRCVRPSHLMPGTPADNMADAHRKGRKNDRGEANGFSKLTEAAVREMRRLYREEGWSQVRLAERFGVDQTHVSDIVREVAWKHVR